MIRLSTNTFLRRFPPYVFLTNQLTRHDALFDESGSVFLSQITRIPTAIESVIDALMAMFEEVSRDQLVRDFLEFVESLERDGFVVTGKTFEEMQRKDPVFTYGMENPKTAPLTPIDMSHPAFKDTTEILMPYFKEHPFIFNLQIEVTSRCNERCRHCYLPHHREMADMDTRLALDILDQAAEMKTLTCTLSGGECLLHKDFEAILRRARSHDMSVSILSNLTTLTDDMAALFREMNLSLVQVSLYSMNAEEHDAITCMAGSHAKTLAAIKKLLAANVPVQISCPTMEINYRSYREVLKWAYAHRMKAYTDHIMMARVDGTTSNLENRLTLGATETLIREMLQYDLEYKTYLDAPLPPDPPERRATEPVCGVGVDTLCVAANGTYYPCAGFQGYPLGDARVERLRNVWEESLPTLRLRNLTNADLPQCLACDAWQYCSRCFVRNFNENNGDMFKVSKHFCDVAFLNKRLVEEYWAVKNP